jgi:hypothetical protein
MKIENIFAKKLARNINGVVKAEQVDNKSVYIELEEYVVTKELDRHFREFFEAYLPSCHTDFNPNTKMGVWIKGFFGSGKSHYLKILSYLLENREVEKDGATRTALDFFKEKISDAMLIADIHSAVSKPADVILFNIDSRANTDEAENALLKVFLKVFNERVGYCADFPHIAHLERELDKRDQYQTFKNKFAELTGSEWEQERDAYDFYRDELTEALATASQQSQASARQWVAELGSHFPLDVKNFCQWVNEYIESNNGRHVLFLVDEVGQFIGKNTQMMLKLQTIVEDLGTTCGGRAWVVVTSQADLDAAIGNMKKREGDDFSKIQGRFGIKPSLSSSNTAEVIQKRLLAKTPAASELLADIYAEKGDILRNQLSFDKSTTAELKPFTDAPSFIDNYPFIPYHYPLVQKVFESIRTKGATGKHLAMGERSLLDAFQSAAKQEKDSGLDVLIPFYCFYSPIESFLEPAVKRTIDQACELETLTDFDGNMLKTLFLIRYVDTVKSTLDNLVTLSIDRIDADKIILRKQIDESLNRLERQLFIARNGDEFVFLTNEEKELENEIRHTDVEISAVSSQLAFILFDDILKRQNKYRYPVNKQDFKISRFCNGHPKDGANLEDLVLKIISPLDAHYENYTHDQQCFAASLDADGCVLVKLGEQKRLWEELTTFVKTDRFLKQNSGQRPEQEHLLRDKRMENIAREKRLRHDVESLFLQADFYAIGTKLSATSGHAASLLDEAYQYIIENTFQKLNVLHPSGGDPLQEVRAVLNADDMAQMNMDFAAEECNPQAMQEVENYINLRVERNEALYLRDIISRFNHRPYGWPDNEILLLVARLALTGKVSFTTQGVPVPKKEAYDAFTNSRKRGELRLQRIRQHDDQQLKKAVSLAKNLFSKTATGLSEKELYELLVKELRNWQEQLKSFKSKAQTGQFPGKELIDQGLALTAGLIEQSNSFALIQRLLEETDALEDFAEDFEDLDEFYNSQFKTWQTLADALHNQFNANKLALGKDAEAQQALNELESIYASPEPYGKLRHIKPLIEKVQKVNAQLITDKRTHAHKRIDVRIARINAALTDCSAPSELKNSTLYALQHCKQRIDKTNSIPQIISEQAEAEAYEDAADQLINAYIDAEHKKAEDEQRRKAAEAKKSQNTTESKVAEPAPVTPKPKRTVTINPAEMIAVSGNAFIETEKQVDDYLKQLREKLLVAIQAGDKVRIK